jgi:uncharacterized protein YkwD
MAFFKKNSRKILIMSLVFLFATLFCNVAKAEFLTGGISGIFNFINTRIVAQIKDDFCKNYILSISTGEWKTGEFRTNLGKQLCASASYSYQKSPQTGSQLQASSSDVVSKITKVIIQLLNGSSTVSATETQTVSSVNMPTPNVYVPDLTENGSDLNAGLIIYWTNYERSNNSSSLVNLKENSVLTNIAEIRVRDMFAKQYFEHTSPVGDNVSKESAANGYTYITIGENIALGNFGGSIGLVTAWMNSPGHRANILNKNYTEIGVYAMKGTYDGQSVWIAAQIFGKPLSGCTEPDATLKTKVNQYKNSASTLMNSINAIDAELKTISSSDTVTYNTKVLERNNDAKLYNNLASEIKTSVAEYNSEVTAYNVCIKTI